MENYDEHQIEINDKKRRNNIVLALILGVIALFGLVWPIIFMVQ